MYKLVISLLTSLVMLMGCSSGPRKALPDSALATPESGFTVELVNDRLDSDASLADRREYRIGGGDQIDVLVYQVEDVSRQYQVNPNGDIQMPLLGAVTVGGLTVVEAQEKIRLALAERYVRDPQVTLSIMEYSANEISVTGEVVAPKIYSIKQGRNPFEMLIMAGGLTKSAGRSMHINSQSRDPNTGQLRASKMVVDLRSIFDPETSEDYDNLQQVKNLILKDGDSIYVPSAGYVYIDGAVKNPGSYDVQDDTTLLSLLALAGGAEWTSSSRKVKVLRKINRSTNQEFDLNLDRIKNNKDENFKLQSGDLVLVGHNSFKYGLKAFWEYGLRLLFIF